MSVKIFTVALVCSHLIAGIFWYKFTRPPEPTPITTDNEAVLLLAEHTQSIDQLGPIVQPYFSKWKKNYLSLIQLFKNAGYSFVSINDFSNKQPEGKVVVLRFDVHQRDIVPAFAVMDLNQKLGIVSDFYLQIPPCEHRPKICNKYLLLKKHKSKFTNFGLHISPLDDWFFNQFGKINKVFKGSKSPAEDLFSFLEKKAIEEGATTEDFLTEKSHRYFLETQKSFIEYFGSFTIASAHGASHGVNRQFRKLIEKDKNKFGYLSNYIPSILLKSSLFQNKNSFAESYDFNTHESVTYLSDNGSTAIELYQSIRIAIAAEGPIQFLIHPHRIHSTDVFNPPYRDKL